MIDDSALEVFEERAENLSLNDFRAWTAPAPHETQILRQLCSRGPKLLSGPRGCGKTTLLRTAQLQLEDQGKVLPVYVNFGRSMFIEPVFSRRSDADGFFQDWLIAKIIAGAVGALAAIEHDTVPTELGERSGAFVDAAEVNTRLTRVELPGPVQLAKMLTEWAGASGRSGVVLLLDDAAHAFVPEQQRIFFEVLRGLRAPDVTYKAAIYPGVTEFSPNFHIGHDAKMVRAWVPVEGDAYLQFMRTAFERRLPKAIRETVPPEVVDFFAVAAFGIPRAFFSLLEGYLEARTSDTGKKPRLPLSLVTDHAEQLRVLHRSLATKLPRYTDYVGAGEVVLGHALDELRQLNSKRASSNRGESAIDLAVRHPVDPRLNTVFGLLEYAGLLRRTNESVSLGKQTYSKFAVHGSLLIASASLKFGQNPTLQDRVNALVRGARTGTFTRVSSNSLLDDATASRCQLRVGSCSNCGEARPSETAKFCSNCGRELVDASRLEELLAASVQELPLTPNKKSSLVEVGIDTVETIVRDRGLQEIGRAKGVGPVWARRIYSIAEEFIGV